LFLLLAAECAQAQHERDNQPAHGSYDYIEPASLRGA
jgi:hypothetical protein